MASSPCNYIFFPSSSKTAEKWYFPNRRGNASRNALLIIGPNLLDRHPTQLLRTNMKQKYWLIESAGLAMLRPLLVIPLPWGLNAVLKSSSENPIWDTTSRCRKALFAVNHSQAITSSTHPPMRSILSTLPFHASQPVPSAGQCLIIAQLALRDSIWYLLGSDPATTAVKCALSAMALHSRTATTATSFQLKRTKNVD